MKTDFLANMKQAAESLQTARDCLADTGDLLNDSEWEVLNNLVERIDGFSDGLKTGLTIALKMAREAHSK